MAYSSRVMVRLGWTHVAHTTTNGEQELGYSSGPRDKVYTSAFYLKILSVEPALCWPLWQIKWNWQRVGCLPWYPQTVEHHACSKCIRLADVQERNGKLGSSITISPRLCTWIKKAVADKSQQVVLPKMLSLIWVRSNIPPISQRYTFAKCCIS